MHRRRFLGSSLPVTTGDHYILCNAICTSLQSTRLASCNPPLRFRKRKGGGREGGAGNGDKRTEKNC